MVALASMAPAPPPMRQCPSCHGWVELSAQRCRHCTSWLSADAKRRAESALPPVVKFLAIIAMVALAIVFVGLYFGY